MSPDGKWVLFMAPDAAGKGKVLWMMAIDGGARRSVETGGPVDPAAYASCELGEAITGYRSS